MSDYPELRAKSERFYRDFMSLKVDLSGIIIPDKPKIPSRLRFCIEGQTHNKLLFNERKQYKVWVIYSNDDIDRAITWNAPRPTDSYAFWVGDTTEPDRRYMGKSQIEADPQGVIGVNLYERSLDGFQYFTETGNHLDTNSGTICTGSRDVTGCIPRVCWDPYYEEVRVIYVCARSVFSNVGLRTSRF